MVHPALRTLRPNEIGRFIVEILSIYFEYGYLVVIAARAPFLNKLPDLIVIHAILL